MCVIMNEHAGTSTTGPLPVLITAIFVFMIKTIIYLPQVDSTTAQHNYKNIEHGLRLILKTDLPNV